MTLRPAALAFLLAATAIAPALRAEQPPALFLAQATAATDGIAQLSDQMMMGEIIAVMREEGVQYGQTLEEEMFPGRGGDRWSAIVAGIYDPDRMRQVFDGALAGELARSPDSLPQIADFFGSGLGQKALRLEIEARRALLDPSVEDAARLAWEDMQAKDDPRVALLQEFAGANDLIESNVMGALNANLAFYRGMASTGAFSEDMTEEQMLSDVWGQEADVRSETEEWLFPFLALAYQPLSENELRDYIAFSETPAGKTINAALFAAFDEVFTGISGALGRAVARQMQGEDI